MPNGIDINELEGEIAKSLREFSDEVVRKVNISSLKIAKETVKKLKMTSPEMTGDYAKSWAMSSDSDGPVRNRIVYVKAPHYRLTHLLEDGHVIANGTGRVRAYPHIRFAEDLAIKSFIDEVEEAINSG